MAEPAADRALLWAHQFTNATSGMWSADAGTKFEGAFRGDTAQAANVLVGFDVVSERALAQRCEFESAQLACTKEGGLCRRCSCV